jgi:hypothetical protein
MESLGFLTNTDEVFEDSGEWDKEVHDETFALLMKEFDSKDKLNRKIENSGRIMLHFAASKGNWKALERLLEYEADNLTEVSMGKQLWNLQSAVKKSTRDSRKNKGQFKALN